MTTTTEPKITFEQAEAILKVNGINVSKVNYVSITELVPESWEGWFWDMLDCYDAPCSFGDANFTMLTGDRLAEHLEESFQVWKQECEDVPSDEDWDQFIGSIWMCNDAEIFIDLET